MKLNEFQKILTILAKEHRIEIKEGMNWAANIGRRIVYYRKEDIYNLSEDHILGLMLHEIAHIHYTTETKPPAKNEELFHSTMNMLEDSAIEEIISKDYPNAAEILEETRMEVLDVLVKMLPKMKDRSDFEKCLLYAAVKFDGRGYEFTTEKYEELGEHIAKMMEKKRKEIYTRKKTENLMPLAQEIVDYIIKKLGEPTQLEKAKLKGGADDGQAHEQSTNEIKNKIIKGLKAGQGWKEGLSAAPNIKFVDAIADQAATIGKQLRTVLKRNNAMEFGGRYRSGKLMAKRFVRIRTIKDRNPFARRIIKSNQSYAFAIASDISGSMFNCGGNIDPGSYALSSLQMVGEALRYANTPRAMIIFGRQAVVSAPMGRTQINWTQLANETLLRKAGDSSTFIDRAIKACTTELKKVRAERKIMIIITDGASDKYAMQTAHKEATKEGIECLGITIGNRNARVFMDEIFSKEKNRMIEDTSKTEEIGKALINILKTSITKSI